MIIEDKELLGDFTIKVEMDTMSVFEPGTNGERKHSTKCKDVPAAVKYIMNRRIAMLDKTVSVKEYVEFINDYQANLTKAFETAEA